ncbi:timeless protein-domain-containing protein [Mycena alexandri]|uniref:Timeless protein-domain-containing protein n=1 Tax=Mycena alexandri TaxID=1745969 RepID=A0AAD6XAF2_9AGAR|nr:timeless protein-domain-containing protein [Mycena alexandri]
MSDIDNESSGSDEEQDIQDLPRDPITKKPLNPRRVLFEPVIGRVVDALGGYEAGTYRLGDEVSGCLKDLKKLWRKDDTDDERTVARILWEKRVLSNDLIPILLQTAGAGQVEDKRAYFELAELDPGEQADFTQLKQAHQHYKATILQPAVMTALFGLLLPPLAKLPRERTLRDNQVAGLVLHIVRNLAAIRDSEGLQSRLVRAIKETHLTGLLLTAAANADGDPLLASWNTLVLEILFLLYRGTPPIKLLEQPKPAPPHHPQAVTQRFGTTITVQVKSALPQGRHRQCPAKALIHTTAPTPLLLDAGKRAVRKRPAADTEAALADDLTLEARTGAFNAFLASLLKDIKMERSWAVGDRVGVWLMSVVRWTVSFFLMEGKEKREFGRVGAAAESGFVSWVLRRMREATEDKPKSWTTLQTGMSCLTQVLLVLDAIVSPTSLADEADAEAAQTLTTQLIYAGAPLDMALECLRARRTGDEEEDDEEERKRRQEAKETTFSLEAFEMKFATAEITRALLLQLGRFQELGNDPEALRRVVSLLHRVAVRAKAEGLFFNVSTLYLFQTILAAQKTFPRDQPHRDMVSLVNYVLRKFFKALEEEPFLAVEAFFPKNRGQWKAFSSAAPTCRERKGSASTAEVQVKRGFSWSEQLGHCDQGAAGVDILNTVLKQWEKVASDLEAEAARAKAESGAPNVEEDDDDDEVLTKRMAEKLETPSAEMREKMVDFLIPYGDDEEANAASRNPRLKLLWRLAKFTLMSQGGRTSQSSDASELEWFVGADVPPADLQRTLKVIEQFVETPINLEGKKAGDLLTKTTKRRRARSPSSDEDGSHAGGSDGSDGEASASGGEAEGEDPEARAERKRQKKEEREQKRKEKSEKKARERAQAKAKVKAKQQQEYKSAQFIEDSDEEYGDIDAFLEKEKEMRDRAEKTAGETGKAAMMLPTGTKKRKKKDAPAGQKRKKKRRGGEPAAGGGDEEGDVDADVFGSRPVEESAPTPPPRARPKPKPRYKPKNAEVGTSSPETPRSSEMDEDLPDASQADAENSDEEMMGSLNRRRKNRLVISDDED